MEIYFANKSGKLTKLLFNSNQQQTQPPPQQAPRQMAVTRKSMLMQDKQQSLKDKIKVEVVGLNVYKVKINPNVYTFNIDNILSGRAIENIDFLDEIQLKNKEKRQAYQDLITISNQISSMGQTKTVIKPRVLNDPVKQIMNLIGCDQSRAVKYLQKYGTVQKTYEGFNNQRNTVQQFMKRFKVKPQQAVFFLESADYNINQAARLMSGNR